MSTNNNNGQKYTVVGTDIEEVKRQNAHSGLSYNEAKEVLSAYYAKKNTQNNPYEE